MIGVAIQFAEATESSSGFGAFNINLKSFIFQLITFVLVLVVFKKWVLPPIQKTIEDRRLSLEKSLEQAKETEVALKNAELKSAELLAAARSQADDSLSEAKKTAAGIIADAETSASARAALIVQEAEEHLGQERAKLSHELRGELAGLVAAATEQVTGQKVDAKADSAIIEKAVKAVGK